MNAHRLTAMSRDEVEKLKKAIRLEKDDRFLHLEKVVKHLLYIFPNKKQFPHVPTRPFALGFVGRTGKGQIWFTRCVSLLV